MSAVPPFRSLRGRIGPAAGALFVRPAVPVFYRIVDAGRSASFDDVLRRPMARQLSCRSNAGLGRQLALPDRPDQFRVVLFGLVGVGTSEPAEGLLDFPAATEVSGDHRCPAGAGVPLGEQV